MLVGGGARHVCALVILGACASSLSRQGSACPVHPAPQPTLPHNPTTHSTTQPHNPLYPYYLGYLPCSTPPRAPRSYKRAVHKTTTNAVPFRRIDQLQLRPQHFVDHLTGQVRGKRAGGQGGRQLQLRPQHFVGYRTREVRGTGEGSREGERKGSPLKTGA